MEQDIPKLDRLTMPKAGKLNERKAFPIKPKFIKPQKTERNRSNSDRTKVLKQRINAEQSAKLNLPSLDSICNSFTHKTKLNKTKTRKIKPKEIHALTTNQTMKNDREVIKNGKNKPRKPLKNRKES